MGGPLWQNRYKDEKRFRVTPSCEWTILDCRDCPMYRLSDNSHPWIDHVTSQVSKWDRWLATGRVSARWFYIHFIGHGLIVCIQVAVQQIAPIPKGKPWGLCHNFGTGQKRHNWRQDCHLDRNIQEKREGGANQRHTLMLWITFWWKM